MGLSKHHTSDLVYKTRAATGTRVEPPPKIMGHHLLHDDDDHNLVSIALSPLKLRSLSPIHNLSPRITKYMNSTLLDTIPPNLTVNDNAYNLTIVNDTYLGYHHIP